MLLGGMWHGASFNFITWGGLNGLGILIYKWWKKQGAVARVIATELLFIAFLVADIVWTSPALNLGAVWTGIICVGTIVRYLVTYIYGRRAGRKGISEKLEVVGQGATRVWNIALTFAFITFTRLFFRSGSNLDPAEANEVAWNTAKNMVEAIGSPWNMSVVPDIVSSYSNVFAVFLFGMIIHWLPERFKRRYRLWFATMPLWLMAVFAVVAVFVVYQFITADLQPFIYFQF